MAGFKSPFLGGRGGGSPPSAQAKSRMQSRLPRGPGVPCARWRARGPRSQPEKLPPVGPSRGFLPGSEFHPTDPPPPLRALPWAPPGVSQGALRGRRFPESWRPCALASGSQTLTCRWSASLRVCVDTSIPLRPSEKRPSLDGSSQEDHRVCTPAPTLFQSVEGPYPALLCPPGASSWTD